MSWASQPALASGASTTSTDSRIDDVYACSEAADSTDPDQAWLTWEDGTDDALEPILTVRTMAWEGMSYSVRVRVLFQGIKHT